MSTSRRTKRKDGENDKGYEVIKGEVRWDVGMNEGGGGLIM